MLNIFKRELFLCAVITVFVILCALAMGSPFVGTSSRSDAAQGRAVQARSMVFQGAVLRIGEQILLRDSSGALFHFDNPQNADGFIGKTVTIDGRLEASSETIHIERIEPAA